MAVENTCTKVGKIGPNGRNDNLNSKEKRIIWFSITGLQMVLQHEDTLRYSNSIILVINKCSTVRNQCILFEVLDFSPEQ